MGVTNSILEALFSIVIIIDTVFGSCSLDDGDLFDVMKELSSLESHYYDIGVGLRLSIADLDNIEDSVGQNPRRALRKVVAAWLQKKYDTQRFGPPTWRMLVEVVDNPEGGNDHQLAKKIALDHPIAIGEWRMHRAMRNISGLCMHGV